VKKNGSSFIIYKVIKDDFFVIAKLFKEKVGVKTTSSAGGSKKL